MTGVRHPGSAGHPLTAARSRALGDAVRAKRRSLGLSQEKLAERIVETAAERGDSTVSFDRQSVNRLENAGYSPSLHRLFLVADALGVPLSELLVDAEAVADRGAG